MVSGNDAFRPYRSDILFLLIGTNPLPNYVAARLLARDKATIYLLHTPGRRGTGNVAGRLETYLKRDIPDACIIRREIDEADGAKIEAKLLEIIDGPLPVDGAVGLNYSGGTKPMSVHTYHVLREAYPDGCFSYLDARTLKMAIRRGDAPTQMLPVGRSVELNLEDVIALHGYKLLAPIRKQPQYSELFLPLAEVVATKQGFDEWAGRWDKRKQSKGWLQQQPLTTLPSYDEYPHLGPVISAFERLGGTAEAVAAYLRPDDDKRRLESCRNWFKGTWLEEYCMDALAEVATRVELKSYGVDLKLEPVVTVSRSTPKDFQLDLAAMVGYQLFAISCIVSEKADGETKKHLFEAYVRARQLGGDEARVALVSCVDNTKVLQDEVERQWDAAGRIQVLGRRQLPHLKRHLRNWFETANKEG